MDLPRLAALRSFQIEGEAGARAVDGHAVEGYFADRAECFVADGDASSAKNMGVANGDVGGGAEDAGLQRDSVGRHTNPQVADGGIYGIAQQEAGGGGGVFGRFDLK